MREAGKKNDWGQWLLLGIVVCIIGLATKYLFQESDAKPGCNRSVSNYELTSSNGESTLFRIPNEYISGSQSLCAVAASNSIYLRLLLPDMEPAVLVTQEDKKIDIVRLEIAAGLPGTFASVRHEMVLPPQVKLDFGVGHNGLLFLGVHSAPKHGIRGRSFFNDPKLGLIARLDVLFHYVPQSLDQTHVAYISCAFGGEFESILTGTFMPGKVGSCRVRSNLTDYTQIEYSIPTTKLSDWDLIDRQIRSALSKFIVS